MWSDPIRIQMNHVTREPGDPRVNRWHVKGPTGEDYAVAAPASPSESRAGHEPRAPAKGCSGGLRDWPVTLPPGGEAALDWINIEAVALQGQMPASG
ncbi:hypothetical protein FZEAL_1076 [Fusarium zealandicum]|uniref:Uncharacterized protein n=1 Tax=Fusarium zealandicum TaxID=1053134 RepID=A0A8H4XPT8_9HYPO|nr:hypothetical protein FZEAL_1076 [Fusarium zealandicum]